ncbi:MAG: DUF6873 family GME fold protein [Acutalibacteraceae bacterium]
MKYNFIEKPNLPESAVSLMAVSGEFEKIYKHLLNYTQIIKSRLYIKLNGAEQYHPDMQLCYLGNGNAVCSNDYLCKEMKNLGFNIVKSEFIHNQSTIKYPECTALNALILGDYVIGRLKSIDKNILDYCEKRGLKLINVNQGYTKCSVAIVSQNAVITADDSIYSALKNKIDVLKIHPGYIDLPGYDYGFIGGCCGLLDKSLLAFTGRIKLHPDHAEIESFLRQHNVNYIELTDERLLDVGSLIPLAEK